MKNYIYELISSVDPSKLQIAYEILKKQPIEEKQGKELINYILCDMHFNHLSQDQEVIIDRIVNILDVEGLY